MQLPFRQGIVTAPPNFLQASSVGVSLVLPPSSPVQITLADKTANYLHEERNTVTNAWVGPFSTNQSYWLYWDIDRVTGLRTFGYTVCKPYESTVGQPCPLGDQHWFDTATKTMQVWNQTSSKWQQKLRVFAGCLVNGSVLVSVSIQSPVYTGTQVGALINDAGPAGAIVFDSAGGPLRRRDGTFFTTEDTAVVNLASSQVKFGALLTEATADENIPAYSVVTYNQHGHIGLANGLIQGYRLYGIVERNVPNGTRSVVTTDGMVSNSAWDWSSLPVNSLLYVSETGQLISDATDGAVPVATVIDPKTILFRSAAIGGSSVSGRAGPPAFYRYRATGGETVITVDIPCTASAPGFAHQIIYKNGVLQIEGTNLSYTITSACVIQFNQPLEENDDVVILSFV